MDFTRRQYLAMAGAGLCHAADDALTRQWRQIAGETDGTVGAAAWHLGSERHAGLRGGERFPLASVCKLPIAIHILAMVGEGKLSLDDEIEIPVQDVVPGVSVVAERWPGQKRFRLNELLEWMVAKSDNSAVQTLFRMGGGAAGMAARLGQWQIEGMRVDRSELECTLDAAGVKPIPPVSQWRPGMIEDLTAKIPPAGAPPGHAPVSGRSSGYGNAGWHGPSLEEGVPKRTAVRELDGPAGGDSGSDHHGERAIERNASGGDGSRA